MKIVASIACVIALALSFNSPARAADAPSATGTWKWEVTAQDGTKRETTLKLKQDGEKLTGTISGRNQETEIKEGSVKKDEVTFKVVRKFQDREITITYTAKLDGDTLKGKSMSGEGDQKREREFSAKRAKE